MRTAYVVITADELDMTKGKPRHLVLAVCPDEATANQYVEVCEIECIAIPAPSMESSKPFSRSCEQ